MTPSSPPPAPSENSAAGSASPPQEFTERPALPDRHDLTPSSLEDAYVRFILHCNPAVPLNSDIESLREAFRNPPRSGGKAFEPLKVYELVRQFYDKDIKTWTELATKLGVEPPDPSKDESSQKVAQYGVRLKKWMHSLHVKSFFEYLMDIPNAYWTEIPQEGDITALPIRDGVALEDDMVLRALLPHMRPKKGRKRPGDDTAHSPVHRRRSPMSSAVDEHRQWPTGSRPAQSTPTELPLFADSSRGGSASWGAGDAGRTPVSRWPQSAITPTMRREFWGDTREPRSAISPPKPRLSSQRRGPKNVSSAWKPGGADGAGKTRGRPPINRGPGEEARTSMSWWFPSNGEPTVTGNTTSAPAPENLMGSILSRERQTIGSISPLHAMGGSLPARDTAKPARPSISLRVPERQGGSVRLATPPPAVLVNGHEQARGGDNVLGLEPTVLQSKAPQGDAGTTVWTGSGCTEVADYYFEKMEDRTNVDALIAFFIQATHDADWVDGDGRPIDPGSMAECTAIVNCILETVYRTATSLQSFFFNLAALAGARALMNTSSKCTRVVEDEEHYMYRFEWEYRFGPLRGHFNITQQVARRRWEEPPQPQRENDGQAQSATLSTEDWRRKYHLLAKEMEARERELAKMRTQLSASLRDDGPHS